MQRTLDIVSLVIASCVAACGNEDPPHRTPLSATSESSARPAADFPLKTWMKATVQPAVTSADLGALATGFDQIASFAPDGYDDWTGIAQRAAQAARRGDLEACRAACKQCHEQHRDRYRAQDRSRALKK